MGVVSPVRFASLTASSKDFVGSASLQANRMPTPIIGDSTGVSRLIRCSLCDKRWLLFEVFSLRVELHIQGVGAWCFTWWSCWADTCSYRRQSGPFERLRRFEAHACPRSILLSHNRDHHELMPLARRYNAWPRLPCILHAANRADFDVKTRSKLDAPARYERRRLSQFRRHSSVICFSAASRYGEV